LLVDTATVDEGGQPDMKWIPTSRLALVAALVVAGVIGTASFGVASAKACGLFSNCTVTVHVTGSGTAVSTLNTGGQMCDSPAATPTGQVGNTCTFQFGWGWSIDLAAQYRPTEGWHFKQWSGSGFAKPVHCDGEDPATNTRVDPWCHFWLWDNLDIRAEFVDTQAPDTTVTGPSGFQRTTSATFRFASSDQTPSTFMCSLDDSVYSPCTSPTTLSGLSQSSHTFRVRAFDPSGNGDPSPALAQWTVDSLPPQNPTLASDHNPAYWSTNPTVGVTFSGAQDGTSGLDGYSYSWDQTADAAPDTVKDAEETATGTTSPTLADGSWYFHLRTVDNAGNWSDTTTMGPFRIDRTPPSSLSVSVPTPAPSTTFAVGWKASDAGSGAVSYDVRYRGASPSTGTFGDYFGWKIHTFDLSAPFTALVPGATYCFSIRAYDTVGNVSSWSGDRCTSVPLDDAALTSGANWTRATGSGYYLGTVSRTSVATAKLTSPTISARRLIVLVTKCPTCGTISVRWNGTIVATADLTATTTQKQQRVTLPTFSQVQTGVLAITVTSSSHPVEVDGVLVSPLA
jgi:hypothetical protein